MISTLASRFATLVNFTYLPSYFDNYRDVVPEGDVSAWSRAPFSGEIIKDNGEDFIFGRGAIDDKQAVLAIMETLDRLIKNGNQPKRSFYVAFGHDEEVSGNQGAGKISKELSNMVNDRYEEIGEKHTLTN